LDKTQQRWFRRKEKDKAGRPDDQGQKVGSSLLGKRGEKTKEKTLVERITLKKIITAK